MDTTLQLRTMVAGLMEQLNQKDLELADLRRQLHVDHLTGCLNRQGFISRLDAMLSNQARVGGSTHLFFIDLDDFKKINTMFKHAGGDYVLSVAGNRLLKTIRAHDIAGRLGGDEFAVAIYISEEDELGEKVWADNIGKRLIDAIAECIDPVPGISVDRIYVTASIGAVCYSGTRPVDSKTLLRMADDAMFSVKHDLKNDIKMHQLVNHA